jgi:hypothetical protein
MRCAADDYLGQSGAEPAATRNSLGNEGNLVRYVS